MLETNPFVRTDVVPSWFANAIQRALSVLSSQMKLIRSDNTHVRIVAGADDQAVVVAIEGRWRWMESTLTTAHPGGAAGIYPVFVTAADNDIVNVPDPATDNTDYSFGLVVRPPAGTPTGVDLYRHIGDAVWDGAKITRVKQIVPASPSHADQHAIGGQDPLSAADIGAVAPGPSISRASWNGVNPIGGGPTQLQYAGTHWSGGSASEYTAPEDGFYLVTASVNLQNVTSPSAGLLAVELKLTQSSNPTVPLVGPPIFIDIHNGQVWSGVDFTEIVELAAGETFKIEVVITDASLAAITASASVNGAPVSVVRVA